ncbi:phosphotransferase [Legionella sp. D16C41]|uniref:phosphotransferase n=1 Tax=Legionella sp. D16C41 TaxID=3402688 RepID=UPI003AF5CE44
MKIESLLQWAFEYLKANLKFDINNYEKIVETSYSVVYKITTNQETLYLKQTPKSLFLEPKTLTYFNKQTCQNIPKIIAENKILNCFLMTSCGEESLRHLFKRKVDLNLLNLGISNYTKIQRTLESKLPQLLALGIPDWRLEKFPSLFFKLIEQKELLINDGLSEKEINQLNESYKTCVNLCEVLSQYQLPETINHCDFHENNMLLNKTTNEISIIDWGETVISHPFFSLNGCLWNITYFNEVKQDDKIYKELQRQCITPWLELYNEQQLLESLTITNQLNGIFAALSYERIYNATMDQTRTVQQDHPGSIAGCLRSFLNHLSH